MQPATSKFGLEMILLHWIIAAAMAVAVIYGLISGYAETAEETRSAMVVHQSIGMLILALAFVRVAARLRRPAPPLPPGMPGYQKAAAAITHILLYFMLFAFPVSGYVALAARGRTISIFGLFDLPNILSPDLSLAATADDLHVTAQWTLYGLVILHVVAALYHQFVVKDGVLLRMWPARK